MKKRLRRKEIWYFLPFLSQLCKVFLEMVIPIFPRKISGPHFINIKLIILYCGKICLYYHRCPP